MKTKTLVLTTIISLGMVFQGCEKEEKNLPLNKNKQISEAKKIQNIKTKSTSSVSSNDLFNPNNPYDDYGINLKVLYTDLEIVFQNPNLTSQDLDQAIDSIININSDINYPLVDTNGYSLVEANIIGSLIDETSIDNIVLKSRETENNILNSGSLDHNQKGRLLSLVSQYKFNFLYHYELYNNLNKANFRRCMQRELMDIFGDNNPVDDIFFIIGIPESFYAVAAYCLYESIFLTTTPDIDIPDEEI